MKYNPITRKRNISNVIKIEKEHKPINMNITLKVKQTGESVLSLCQKTGEITVFNK